MVKRMIYALMLLIVMVVLILIAVITIAPKTANTKEFAFRFKDYRVSKEFARNAQAAREALLLLHPIGTSVESLLLTLEKTDAECISNFPTSHNKDQPIYPNPIFYRCSTPGVSVFGYTLSMTDWMIKIIQRDNVIQDISVESFYSGL